LTTLLMKEWGAAVSRTERTEEVGRAEASWLATPPRERRTAGSVGRAVRPAIEALIRMSMRDGELRR